MKTSIHDNCDEEPLAISAQAWNRGAAQIIPAPSRKQSIGSREAACSPAPDNSNGRALMPKYHQTRLVKSMEKSKRPTKKRVKKSSVVNTNQ